MKATYIELINRFWAENRRRPFSPCQSALYFFLLNEANAVKWVMPVAVPTAVACQLTGMGKSSLIRAREALRERGLITFTLGAPRRESPSYAIVGTDGESKRDTNNGANNSTNKGTNGGTNNGTNDGTHHGTNNGAIIKDKDIDKERGLYLNHNSREEKTIEDMEKLFMADREWQDTIIKAISSDGISKREDVQERLRMFFAAERAKGVKKREEMDCRSHFFHWIKKITDKKRTEHAYSNQHRLADVTAQSPNDYKGRF